MQDREGIRKFGEDWAFFGGGIEVGETPEQGVERELKEELGMEGFEYFKLYSGTHINRLGNVMINRNVFMHFTDKDENDFTVYEGAGAKFFPLEDLRKLILPGPIETYEEVLKKAKLEYSKHYGI